MSEGPLFNFEFSLRARLVFGAQTIDRLGELAAEHGGRRVLLITDQGLVAAGHPARAQKALESAGMTVSVFDGVIENPTTAVVKACVEHAREDKVDFIIGLGGGSSMDTAKGCNFLLTNGGDMEDYWGVGKATQPMLPFIAVPTTAGTGSECQSFALISQEKTHVKMACGDKKAAATVAVLDPALTRTQPPMVAACTGMDALSHALESAVSTRCNRLSQMLSREAFALCVRGLDGVFSDPDCLESRGKALLGAALAGAAIENSMLGAAHAAANPLTARHGLIHGRAVGIMLPAVIRFNAADTDVRRSYADLAVHAGLMNSDQPIDAAADLIIAYIEQFRRTAGLPHSLVRNDIPPDQIPSLAEEAATQWTGSFNPRSVTADNFRYFYESVLDCPVDGTDDVTSRLEPARNGTSVASN